MLFPHEQHCSIKKRWRGWQAVEGMTAARTVLEDDECAEIMRSQSHERAEQVEVVQA